MNSNKIIKTLCEKFNIDLLDLKKLKPKELKKYVSNISGDEQMLRNRSFVIGNDEIHLGIYDDEDKRLASFFHELGHILIKKKYKIWPKNMTTLHWEIECWNIGLSYAFKNFNIIFKETTIKWAYEQALTYFQYK
jgi:hypothetical protein